MVLSKRISRLPSIDCVTWSLEFTFLQAYNEKKQMGQREIQIMQCGERKGAQEG